MTHLVFVKGHTGFQTKKVDNHCCNTQTKYVFSTANTSY